MCKKLTCDASQKDSKIYNWITFFRLVENYIHFSYPKWGKVVTRSEIGKFGDKDEKYYIRKFKQCVTHLWPTCDPNVTQPVPNL